MERESRRQVRGNGKLIKSLNQSRILECLQDAGPLSRVQLVERTGISLPAVSQLVADLLKRGLILNGGRGPSSGGRPPELFTYNVKAGYCVGLDIGGTKIAGGLADLDGNLLARATIPTHEGNSGAKGLAERIVHLVRRLVRQAGLDMTRVIGIGAGFPGIPDPEGTSLTLAPGLGSDAAADDPVASVVAALRSRLEKPLYVDNDVNMVLRGEVWKGALKGTRHAVCVTVGTGIGVGLLVNGEVYRGAHGAAGEVGTWLIGSLGPVTRPKGYGPLERYAAGPGIARRYAARVKEQGRAVVADWAPNGNGGYRQGCGRPVESLTAKEVAEAAELGDTHALQVWKETTDTLGVALANVCSLVDPEKVVVGGGVSRAGASLFLEPIKRIVETLVPFPPVIVASELGEDAGVIGAVAAVLESRRDSISFVRAGVQP